MVTIYYILETESDMYYNFFGGIFVYDFDFDCMTTRKEFVFKYAETLKNEGYKVEVQSHEFN